MAGRIRAHHWAATPLGPIEGWPQSRKTAVDMMLASGHAMQLAWGPERTVLYNDAYAPMLGDRHPVALGLPFREAWPDIWGEIEPLVARVFAGETVRFEDMPLVMTRHGYPEDAWWNFSYSPVRDESGAVAGLLNVTMDVTGRMRAERAERERDEANARLRENEARFRALLTAGAQSIYRMSQDWRVMHELDSRTVASTSGPFEDWPDKYILEEDRPRVFAAIERAMLTKSLLELEYRVRLADGNVGWVLSRAVPLLTPGGEIIEWFGAGSDVTDRKQAEAALRESEARLRTLVEGIPQLVWRAVDGGTWTWASPQWTAYTDLSDAASRGRGWLDAVHPDDHGAAEEGWRRAGEAGRFEADYRIRCAADGAWRWFQTRGTPVRDNRGDITEWLGTSTDIDDQVQARDVLKRAEERLEAVVSERTAELMAAEQSLRQSQKMEAVGQLTGGLAHDFNNMLQGIASGVQMARRRVAVGRVEDAERYLDMASGAVSRAAGLTRRLLAFARRQRLAPVPVDADGLIGGLADLLRRTVGPGVGLDLSLHNGGGSIMCDPNELENALLNLCINARDAMPDGGRLTIGTADAQLGNADFARDEDCVPGRYVTISIADTGMGMPPEVLNRVFEPFFTTKPLGEGTGLGLSMIYGFVRQSGGVVRISSTPGQGTTVRLLLPMHDRAEASAGMRSEARTPDEADHGAALRVLLVDDEATVRRPVADRLRELGFKVLEAGDGPAALQFLDMVRPDLLVTDVGLPGGMNGRQVAEAARERIPDLPVLFITGYATTELPPGFEVIDKPFELDDLALRVQAILKAGKPQRDLALVPGP